MKKTICVLCLLPCVAFADLWRGLDEANHYSGPLVTEADLLGKVVLVDEWGVRCPPCRALLPRMESLWSAYKSKPFVLLGSHRQGHQPDQVKELVKANKLTYPIYERAGLVGEPSGDGMLPFMYVVNHRGKVVYAGRSHQEATQAVVEALMKIGAPPNLVDGVAFKKYKAIEKQLVLGKPLKGLVAKLEGDIKKAQAKTASAALKAQAEEAEEILAAVKKGRDDIKEEIETLKQTNPPEAVKLIGLFMKSFPGEGAAYKEQLPELTAKAKEFAAAQKAKAKEVKAAKGKK
jgi:hypothetical protein